MNSVPSKHIEVGRQGEDRAVSYLMDKGFRILARNFRVRQGELDIIAYDQEVLVFVEVKTDKTLKAGYPEEWVSVKKIKKIQQVAQIFCAQRELTNALIRFDVLTINLQFQAVIINHIENAFIPSSDGYYKSSIY